MTVTIRTNYHWRDFVYRWDVPADILEADFNWMKVTDPDTGIAEWPDDEYIDGFFKYAGCWFHLTDFMRWTCPQEDQPLENWHGYCADSFFSGVLIRLSGDGERYQIATYCA